MRVVFMGTPDFAVGTLEAIIRAGHKVEAVITQPDKPHGRSGKLVFPPVKEKALEYNIPVYQPVKLRQSDVIDKLKEINPDVIVVVAFGQILPKSVLELPRYGCVNVHASLLPKYRGAAPIQWAVINGDEESGVTTMLMNDGIDTGDMLKVRRYKLAPKETGGSLFDKLSILGAGLLIETLDDLEKGVLTPVPQTGEATYAGKLDKSLGHIDFMHPAAEIERLIRGLNPWPSAYTSLDGKTLKIWQADVDASPDTDKAPGTVYAFDKNGIYVMTGDGGLIIRELQLEGRKRMSAGDFLRGYTIKEDTVLG